MVKPGPGVPLRDDARLRDAVRSSLGLKGKDATEDVSCSESSACIREMLPGMLVRMELIFSSIWSLGFFGRLLRDDGRDEFLATDLECGSSAKDLCPPMSSRLGCEANCRLKRAAAMWMGCSR